MTRPLGFFGGECCACGDLTPGDGDTFCLPCWQRISDEEKQTYLALWRAGQPVALDAFVRMLARQIRLAPARAQSPSARAVYRAQHKTTGMIAGDA
jgi:hypothetical protein